MSDKHYDVIVIGSGAGGGTMTYALAPSGKRILLLERGDFLPKERQNWDTYSVFCQQRYVTDETWYNGEQPFRPTIHYWVGGNTKMYGAAMFRLRERDFQEIKYPDGISPAWPLSYQDFAPYYTRAERLYHVHGQRGIDPTEPPMEHDYLYGPLPHEPRIQKLADDLEKLGYHPFPLPLGVRLGDDKPYPQPSVHLSAFDGYPDPSESKADAQVIAVNPALEFDNVTLMVNSLVTKLETDASGRSVTQVHVEREGEQLTFSADIVVVAAGAANSAALFLRCLLYT
ncbi:MAG: GMC family oxidoreductase, partial [Chloroflexi bacterium]|nr:GMC family oxidoreductase [Chloroflexota bacterium]